VLCDPDYAELAMTVNFLNGYVMVQIDRVLGC
jgi:hypothetical protein